MDAVVTDIRPVLAVLCALAAVIPINIFGTRPNIRETWTFIFAGITFLIVLSLLPGPLNGITYEYSVLELLPGVALKFKVDALGMLFALVSSPLWIITTCYAIGYMRAHHEHSQTRFYSFFAVAIAATLGVAFSANLLTLYLFYEALSLSTYPLVTHHQDGEAQSAGRKYLLYILGTSIGFVLPALIITYTLSGTLDFTSEGVYPAAASSSLLIGLAFMFLFGFAKAGTMPFHSWLPGAMVAPTPVSALLHAVAVVKVGVFSILRVFTGIFGLERISDLFVGSISLNTILCTIVSITLLLSSMIALSQDGLKRRLAFSTIGQLSYITLGVLLLSPHGIIGGFMHIAMHAFGKITLFFCAGAIFVATGKKYVSQLNGLGRKMPFTFAAFFIGSLSIIGLPPTGGFISKWQLLVGTLEGQQTPFLVVYLLSSFLAAAYFFPIVFRGFFAKPTKEDEEDDEYDSIKEAPICCVAPLMLTALITLILFFYPDPFYSLAVKASSLIIGG